MKSSTVWPAGAEPPVLIREVDIEGLLGDLANLRQFMEVVRMFEAEYRKAEPRLKRLERLLRGAL